MISRGGRRSENEDRAGFAIEGQIGCWIVADGLGGHASGALAAELAVTSAVNAFRRNPRLHGESLRELFTAAQQSLASAGRAQPATDGMRTTAVILLTDGRSALWGHVGDSRLYLIRGQRIVHRTRDHSVAQALISAGQIAESELARQPERSLLLRNLSGSERARPSIAESPCPLQRGDVLLLCTDGFWEALGDEEIAAVVASSGSLQEGLDRIVAEIDRIKGSAPRDDCTALAVRIA